MEFQDQISVLGCDTKAFTEHQEDKSVENEIREARLMNIFEQIEEARGRVIKAIESEFVRLTEKVESLSRETNYSKKESQYEYEVMKKIWMKGVWGLPAFERT